MAVVGSAEIVVRAITLKVKDDIQKAFRDAKPAVEAAGKEHGRSYYEGFQESIKGKLPESINQAMARTNARQPGKEKGDDFAKSFSGSVTSGIDLDSILKRVDVGDVGKNAGKKVVDDLDKETQQAATVAERNFTRAGDRGGKGFIGGFKQALKDYNAAGLGRINENAARTFTKLFTTAQAGAAAIGLLVQGASSAVAGLFAMGAAASSAVGALGVLPGVMGVVAQAGIAMKLAFKGVGKAVEAGMAPVTPAVKQSATAVANAARAIRDAQAGIADASRNAARAVEDANERVSDAVLAAARANQEAERDIADAVRASSEAITAAKRDLKEAYADAAQSAADAAVQVAEAENDVKEAQQGVLIAQKALTQARLDGAESLQQLAFSAEGAALSEERAGLRLEEAHAKMVAASQLPPDNKSRVEAELAFKEAELGYREAKDRASDLKKENIAASKAGVDGTKDVVDARNKITSAQNTQIDAENRLAKARNDQARDAVEAQNKIIDASNKLAKVQADGARKVADAQRKAIQIQLDGADNVADAEKDAAQARADAARSVAKAQQALKDALDRQKESQEATTKSVDKYKQLLQELSPSAQEFVKYLVSTKGATKDLREAIGDGLFPKLQTALEPIIDNLFPRLEKILGTTGEAIGNIAIAFSEVITSKEGLGLIESIMGRNNKILDKAAPIVADLALVFLRLLDAVGPLTDKFVTWFGEMAKGWAKSTEGTDGMKKLTDFFEKAGDTAGQLFRIFGNLWGIIKTLGGASEETGKGLLDSFEGATKKLDGFLKGLKPGVLSGFFSTAGENLKVIGTLIAAIAGGFLKIGGDPKTGEAFQKLLEAKPYIEAIFKTISNSIPSFATLVVAVARFFGAFAASDATSKFFDTLTGIVSFLAKILEGPFAQALLNALVPIMAMTHAFALLRIGAVFIGKIFLGMLSPVVKLGALIGRMFVAMKAMKALGLKGAFGAATQKVKDALPGSDKRKADKAAKADAADGGTGKFTGNLKKLATQFGLTGKAKDKFITNLQKLSTQMGLTGTAASKSPAGKVPKVTSAGTLPANARKIPSIPAATMTVTPPPVAKINAQMRAAGQAARQGFAQGLSTGVSPALQMEKLTQEVILANKRMLGIASPSKVFMRIGQDVGLGFVNGMKVMTGPARAEGAALASAAAGGGMVAAQTQVTKSSGVMGKALTGFSAVGKTALRGLGGAFNVLMGPIGMIAMIVIPLLIAAFKKLYDSSPGFRAFIDGIVSAFKTVGGYIKDFFMPIFAAIGTFITGTVLPAFARLGIGIMSYLQPVIVFFQTVLLPAILPIFQAIVNFIQTKVVPIFQIVLPIAIGVLKNIFAAQFKLIGLIVNTAIKVIVFIVTKILIPLFKNIIIPGVILLYRGFKAYFTAIRNTVNAVFNAIKFVWEKVLKPTLAVISAVVKFTINAIKDKFTEFRTKWSDTINAIKAFWAKYGAPFIEAVRSSFKDKIDKIKTIIDGIRSAFITAVDAVKTWWTKHGQPIIDAIGKSFTAFGSGVTKVWEALKDAPKVGLQNLIDNLNKWLIGNLNKFTIPFGLTIPDIPGLAEGGIVEGRGGPKEDNQLRRLSVGEAVIKEESVRRLGPRAVEFMNRTGTLPAPGGTGGVGASGSPRGGVFKNAKDGLLDKLKSGKESVEGLLKKGAGFAIDKVMGGFSDLLPKGSNFFDEMIRKIWESARSHAKSWGQDRQEEADAAAAADGSGGSTAGGFSGARGVWNALITAGMKPVQAAGIMGNMEVESGFMWQRVQGGGVQLSNSTNHGGGYGLVQWTPGTKLGKMLGDRQNNLENQIAVLVEQLNGKHGMYQESGAGKALRAAKTVGQAARAFMLKYERPRDQGGNAQASRAKRAQRLYEKFKGVEIIDPDAGLDGGIGLPGGGGNRKYSLGPSKPAVKWAAASVGNAFGIKTIYGYVNKPQYHGKGLALDFMINNIKNGHAVGNKLEKFLRSNYKGYGINELIWDKHIRTQSRGWDNRRSYSGPSDHTDHVHASFGGKLPKKPFYPKGASDPDAGGGSGSVPNGKKGWVYPLARRGKPARTYSGHRLPGSYDISTPIGNPVRAASQGTISRAQFIGEHKSYGRVMMVSHANGVKTLYAHLSKMLLKKGTRVGAGQTIGKSGNAGRSTGPHLHFQLTPSGNTKSAMAKRGVRLATGGIVQATDGGVIAMIGEAGRNERVEPLDSQGLSVRDRALIELLTKNNGGGQGTGIVDVKVYIGETELNGLVDMRISARDRQLAKDLSVGPKRRYR